MESVDAVFFSALMTSDRKGIQKWIDRGANPHAVNKREETTLMVCSNIEALGWLINEGVAIDARDTEGRTALPRAAEQGQLQKVRLLLNHGAHVDARDNWGDTPLFKAATWHKPQVVRLLLEHGADIFVRDKGGRTPLMSAAWPWPQDTEVIETLHLLLNYGIDVNAVDNEGQTALIHLLEDDQYDGACETMATLPDREAAYAEIVRLLLDYNADPGIMNFKGNTALHFSVLRKLDDVVALLKRLV